MISCPEDDELLAVLAGESSAEPLRAHVCDCSECSLRLEKLQAELTAIRGLGQISLLATPAGVGALDQRSRDENGVLRGDCPPGQPQPAARAAPIALALSDRNDNPSEQSLEGTGELPPSIGKYLVVGKFPRSGQADVFRVVHPELHRDLVLKLAHRPAGDDGLSEILADGQRLAALEHPNIVRVYDLDFFKGRPYLVMEFIRGRTLTQFSREEVITPRIAATYTAELASAVAFAHRRGIVHQDIKPANVLIDEAGTVRLIDFGLAWQHDAWSMSHSHSEGGTFAFMAPEQARVDLERIRPLSDVFSIGAVLYFLLTGSGPFAAESAEESWDRARHCKLDRTALKRARVPRVLERICLKTLASEPEQRYRSAAQLERALRHFLRSRLIKLAAAACAVLVLAGGLVLTYPRADPRRAVSRAQSEVAAIEPAPSSLSPPRRLPVTLNIEHMSKQGENAFEMRGNLGERSFGVQADDDITIDARLAQSAYAYLIAYRPDGIDEICDPEAPDLIPAKSANPRYPPLSKPDRVYRLNDGSGLIAFALVVSKSPLPSYREWKNRFGIPPWRKGISGASGVVWWDDGQRLAALAAGSASGERGSGERIRGGGTAVADLALWLRAVPGIDLVAVKAFQVPPAVESMR